MKSTRPLLLFILVALLLMAVPATFAQDPITLPPEVQTALQNTSAATSARFNFTLDLAATGDEPFELGLTGTGLFGPDLFQITVGGDLPAGTMGSEAMPFNLELRGVNGSLFVYIPLLLTQWIEVSPEELAQGINGAPIDLSDIGGSLGGATGMGDMPEMTGMMSELNNYVTVTTNGNVTSIDVDLIGLLSSPTFQQMVIDSATEEDPSVDPADIQEFFASAPTALAGTAVHAEITVGSDNRVSNILFSADFNVDPTELPPAAQEEAGLTGPTSVSIDFNLSFSEYDADFTGEVEEPTDTMPFSDIMSAFMGDS